MTLRTRQSPCVSPASIAIHDDGDVARYVVGELHDDSVQGGRILLPLCLRCKPRARSPLRQRGKNQTYGGAISGENPARTGGFDNSGNDQPGEGPADEGIQNVHDHT